MYLPLRLLVLVLLHAATTDVCLGSPVGQVTVSSHNLTGHSMLQLGTSFNNSLLSMLGHAMVSLEEYIDNNIADLESRLTTKLCELSPCTPWSVWRNCTARKKSVFGGQMRTRTCWIGNTTPCANNGEQVIENESRVCEGFCPVDYNISSSGLCLMAITGLNSREDSEKICNEKGGNLINTDTKERWDAVEDIGNRLKIHAIWIDGLRSVQGGTWTYAAGSEPTLNGLQHWLSGEPSNSPSELCKCAYKTGGKYYWFDVSCSDSRYGVCEIRM